MEVPSDEFPTELSEKLSNFHESLDKIESVLSSVVSVPLNEIHEKLKPIDQAKFDIVMAYSLNSLFWMYLNTQGENPTEHNVKIELERIKDYMNKVKEIVDKEKAPRLDADAAKRFVRGSLWTPKEKETSENSPVSKGLKQKKASKKTSNKRKSK